MAKKIAIVNQKGGVGKTATSVNLASSLSLEGSRVLLVDADYQGNAGSAFGVKQKAINENRTIGKGMIDGLPAKKAIVRTEFKNIDVIAADMDFGEFNSQFIGKPGSHLLFKEWIEPVENDYDFMIIDTHPSLDLTFQNVMSAADYYIIPLFAEPDSVDGLHIIFKHLNEIQSRLNPRLKNLGCIITKYKSKNATHKKFLSKIEVFGHKHALPILKVIPDSDAMSSSSDEQIPVVLGKPSLPVSKAYRDLATAILPKLTDKRGRPQRAIKIERDDIRDFMNSFDSDLEGLNVQKQVRL
ncbi:MAG TPA: AAA family ATPase [Oligoflexus sp.]|uniref:ParA family protein n=1 Tax=Oligoflexus sp. TaxID=1971216 RepID=UPI002D28C045|nr:AAA family ATPase [Oligoflexus sp.]HYX32201.1 AAA family ATPase [Oligoflexus sp.]